MKKLFLIATISVAGTLSANTIHLEDLFFDNAESVLIKKCIEVNSGCGEGGVWFACAELNEDGEVDHEVSDDMRQLLKEAFCGYGD